MNLELRQHHSQLYRVPVLLHPVPVPHLPPRVEMTVIKIRIEKSGPLWKYTMIIGKVQGAFFSCVTFGDKAILPRWSATFSLRTSWSICSLDRTAKKGNNHYSVIGVSYDFPLPRMPPVIHSFLGKHHSSLGLCSHFTCWFPNLNISLF